MPVDDVPERMSWAEAWRLFNILGADPSSQIVAAIAGWKYPATRADLVLRDLFDLEFRKAKRNPKKYQRPWDKAETKVIGAGGGMSIEDYQAMMARQLEDVAPADDDEEASDG